MASAGPPTGSARRATRRRIAATTWAVVVSWCASASALEEPPVLLLLDGCPELEQPEVRRIVAAELGARPATSAGPDVTEVTVACTDSRVMIRVHDPLSRKNVQRSFDLGLSDPRARARLVSIAATELVLASWAELESNPSLHVEPEGPKAPSEATRAAKAIAVERRASYTPVIRHWYDAPRAEAKDDHLFRVVALGSVRSFFDYRGALHGGGVRVGEERFGFASWALDGLVESGTIQTRDGAYDVVTTTAGGTLYLYRRAGPVTGRVGAGLRAGLAIAGPDGSSQLTPWGWPLGAASVTVSLAKGLVLELSGEGGYVVLPVPGHGELSGGWFSGQAGLGIVPGALFPPGPPEPEAERVEEREAEAAAR